MQFDSGILGTIAALGRPEERQRIRDALESFSRIQGYSVVMESFKDGSLTVALAPAERALLRYDMPRLYNHLERCGLRPVVRVVVVRTRALQ